MRHELEHVAVGQADKAPGITEELAQAVEALDEQIQALAETLRPVSRNEPRKLATGDDVMPIVSPMRENLNRIIAATGRLVAMREDCEL
jgi:hypothetical protein